MRGRHVFTALRDPFPRATHRRAWYHVQGLKLDLIEFQPPALGDDEVFVDIKVLLVCANGYM